MFGFKTILTAEPNDAHYALSTLERKNIVKAIITQNVDGLHQKAGSKSVVDLHGRIDAVICLSCEAKQSRSSFQVELELLNKSFLEKVNAVNIITSSRPDGDLDLGTVDISDVIYD